MASESAMLGTPAIYLDNEGRGYTNRLESEYEIVFNFKENTEDVIRATDKAIKILNSDKEKYQAIRERILEENIDTSEYIYKIAVKYNN